MSGWSAAALGFGLGFAAGLTTCAFYAYWRLTQAFRF